MEGVNFDAVGATTSPEVAAVDPEASTEAPVIWKTSRRTAMISATPIPCAEKLATDRIITKVSQTSAYI